MIPYQDIVLKLDEYWRDHGAVLGLPYNSEVGAGTFNPFTFFYVLDERPWCVAYVEPSKRPKDGRYAENPMRLQQFIQYQVIVKPAPHDIQEIYLRSLQHIGIELKKHDVRFVEDDWESETLGASGLGWEVWVDGMEVTQFTYFQQMGGIELKVIPVELTYGLERLAMLVQNKRDIFDIIWTDGISYGDIWKRREYEFSVFNFDEANIELHFKMFESFVNEFYRLLEHGLIFPAYDYLVKASHTLNVLDARRAISPEERQKFIAKVRRMANSIAKKYLGYE